MRMFAFAAMLMVLAPALSAAEWKSVDEALASLDRVIGSYPPDIKSEKQKRSVIARYDQTKKALDAALSAQPGDTDNLLRRARLPAMGHNLDLPGAFAGAERDYAVILNDHPTHERAILELANMWVNSSPDYAPRAEKLYLAAQCLHQDEPLEEAQRGLFFALYYQGRFEDTKRQTEFLVSRWPDQPMYRKLDEMAGSVLEGQGQGQGKQRQTNREPRMISCG